MKSIVELYRHNAGRAHDINQHLPYLAGIALNNYVLELGFRTGRSTSAFLFGGAHHVRVCDINPCKNERAVFEKLAPRRFVFEQASSLDCYMSLVDGGGTIDILFIDSYHSGALLRKELSRFHRFVNKAIVMHDTVTFGQKGEGGSEGLMPALKNFMENNLEWGSMIHFPNNNGLTIIRKK